MNKKKRKTTKAKPKKTDKNTGVEFEKTVARIQQKLDPGSTVTHDETLVDRVGNCRQFDVVIRGQFGGRDVLGVIECRDHKRRKGPSAIEGFAKKAEHVNANLRLMVSRRGFTEQALNLARHEGIGCLSLLPEDPKQVGFGIGEMWYARLLRWGQASLTVYRADEARPLPTEFASDSVSWNGKPVMNWFLKQLDTRYRLLKETGTYTLAVKFDRPRDLEIAGDMYSVKGLSFSAERIREYKRQWVTWSGDAFYDWHAGTFAVPPSGVIVGSPVDVRTFADWMDWDRDVPAEGTKFFRMYLEAVAMLVIPDDVVDLSSIIVSHDLIRTLNSTEPEDARDLRFNAIDRKVRETRDASHGPR
jgi:hypothetical protein